MMTYYLDMAGDVVVEAAGEGTDTIYFKGSTSYVLGANVENLYMSNAVGAVNGTGNGLDNSISGNDDVNTLTGGGGDDNLFGHGGADTMIGGIGDDDYWVEDAGDVVTELADQGTDKIYFTGSYQLLLAANVENLDMSNAVAQSTAPATASTTTYGATPASTCSPAPPATIGSMAVAAPTP